jgi:hypothetical protein
VSIELFRTETVRGSADGEVERLRDDFLLGFGGLLFGVLERNHDRKSITR